MADDDDFKPASGATSSDDLAVAMALGARGSMDPQALAYLKEQTRLAQLQSENMIEQNAFELSHLKWRRFNDRLRGAWQSLLVLFGGVIVVAIAGLMWSAHEATGLVVQPLSAPPGFAERGLAGTVLAQRMLDKLNGLVARSGAYSIRTADSIGGNWGDDSKVEIPQTGISISELSRALRGWLGSETRVSGEVWRTGKGIAISVRAGANPGVELNGSEAELDGLLDGAALTLLEQTQPFRYANLYMDPRKGDTRKALAIFRHLAAVNTGRERAWALVEIGIALGPGGNEGLAVTNEAVRLDPGNPFAYTGRANANASLGHAEAVVQDLQRQLSVIRGHLPDDILPSAVESMRFVSEGWLLQSRGAFSEAAAIDAEQEQRGLLDAVQLEWIARASNAARAHDGAAARALLVQHQSTPAALITSLLTNFSLPAGIILAIDVGDWSSAASALADADKVLQSNPQGDDVRHTLLWPWLAYAWAKNGEVKKASELIARTPHDCTLCLQMRGRIALAAGDTRGAAFWYARAVNDAPSVPFAAADWGELLLAKGDLDGAIAKFRIANARGAHFADPLEMWGEVLMRLNRSDLALAKFAEAAKYAPNWGRLHLKWGEALRYTGRIAEAKRAFAVASGLDLTTEEESELAKELGRG